jgi:hypothetical protein
MDRLDIQVNMCKFRSNIEHWDHTEMDYMDHHVEALLLNKRFFVIITIKIVKGRAVNILRGGGFG